MSPGVGSLPSSGLAGRQQQWQARARRWREGWSIFRQNRIAVAGLVLIVLFGLMPVAHRILRASVWQEKLYDPVFGFDINSAPNPAPPSWIPADWLAEANPHRFDRNRPSYDHLLGTDTLGRDVLSVLLAAAANTFIVGITSGLTTLLVGVTFAALSAYYRGWIDGLLTHISDAFLLLPAPIFMIAVGVYLQSQRTVFTEIIYQGLTGEPLADSAKLLLKPFEFGLIYGIIAGAGGAAIVLRSHGLKVMTLSFVEASRVAGASGRHVIFRHLVPHMVPVAGVYILIVVIGAVVADGFLSFFGLNPNPLNWGTMIYDAFTYRVVNAEIAWNALLAPAMAISLFAAAFYMVSRGMHQVVEPRIRDDYGVSQVRRVDKEKGKRRKGSALDLLLIGLVILALAVLAALVYVLVNPPF